MQHVSKNYKKKQATLSSTTKKEHIRGEFINDEQINFIG